MHIRDLNQSLTVVATFGAFVATLAAVPIGNLKVQGAISATDFTLLYILPGALAVLVVISNGFKDNPMLFSVWAVLAGVCQGMALALALLGLLTAYFWYSDSGKPHLEPLFTLLAFAGAAAEGGKRVILAISHKRKPTAA